MPDPVLLLVAFLALPVMQAAYERAHPEGRDPDRCKAALAQQWLFRTRDP